MKLKNLACDEHCGIDAQFQIVHNFASRHDENFALNTRPEYIHLSRRENRYSLITKDIGESEDIGVSRYRTPPFALFARLGASALNQTAYTTMNRH